MKMPLQLKGSVHSKSQFTQGGILALFVGLGLISFFHARTEWQTSGTGSPAEVMAQAIEARLNGVSEGITAYLQTHDAASLERIKSEGKEAGRLLEGLKEESSWSGSGSFYRQVEKAHENMREATVDLLAIDHSLIKSQESLNASKETLQSLLTETIQPSIRSNQMSSTARLRAVRTASALTGDFSANSARFNKTMETYADLSGTRRAALWAQQAKTLFNQCASQAQEIQKSEGRKQAAVSRYRQTRRGLESALKEPGFGSGPAMKIRYLLHLFSSGLGYGVAEGCLIAWGIFLVWRASRRTQKQLVQPLRDVLQCIEAAAAGDTSRTPDHWSQDEVGQLSQAAGRLISVLARSENLVYHLAALVESSGEAIISHTLDGTILSWNKGAQRIYGYSAEEVKGRSIAILSPQDQGAELMRQIQRIREGERIRPFETLHVASNGRRVRALVRVSAILDSTRKVIGASFCAQDLTETELLKPKNSERPQIA